MAGVAPEAAIAQPFRGAKASSELPVDLRARGRILNIPLSTALASLIAGTLHSRFSVLFEGLHQLKPPLRQGFSRDVLGLRTKHFTYHTYRLRPRAAHVMFFRVIGVE